MIFDRFLVNPKRGAWDIYLKAWPVLVVAMVVIGGVSGATREASAYGSGSSSPYTAPQAPAHQCWADAAGDINGCQLSNGSVLGTRAGTPITCYFYDADLRSATTLSCR